MSPLQSWSEGHEVEVVWKNHRACAAQQWWATIAEAQAERNDTRCPDPPVRGALANKKIPAVAGTRALHAVRRPRLRRPASVRAFPVSGWFAP